SRWRLLERAQRQPYDEPRAVDVLDRDRTASASHFLADERETEAALPLAVARDLGRESIQKDLAGQRRVDAGTGVVNRDHELSALDVECDVDVAAGFPA